MSTAGQTVSIPGHLVGNGGQRVAVVSVLHCVTFVGQTVSIPG